MYTFVNYTQTSKKLKNKSSPPTSLSLTRFIIMVMALITTWNSIVYLFVSFL